MSCCLTVIVPCYNGEKTLPRALDSLISQTFLDFEVLIINDGSHDASGRIADTFAARDSRFHVIHKPVNEGLSAGRNTGMAAASGRYITFLDCDDWLEPDIYEKMLASHSGADIIVTGAYHDVWNQDGTLAVSTMDKTGISMVSGDAKQILHLSALLDEKRLFAYTWNKLYRREFLEENSFRFLNQTLIEDFLFNCAVWGKASSVELVDGCYYHYVKWSDEALTQRYRPEYFEIMDKRYCAIRDLLNRDGETDANDRVILGNMHIKHLLAGMIKNCSPKAGMTAKKRADVIHGILKSENCRQAVAYAKGKRLQEKVCNGLFALGWVPLLRLFAAVLYRMQNSKGHFFDKLK